MTVYKATNEDMSCTRGDGNFRYVLGKPAVAEASGCGRTGLHACEYVIDCTEYYGLGFGNRFFEAAAEGDIAEDGRDTRIACTRLTLTQELDNRGIARAAMFYMISHPKRSGWERKTHMIDIDGHAAQISIRDGIAIARGKHPQVRGCRGAHLGLIVEQEGRITAAKLFTVDGEVIKPGLWYTVERLARTEKEAAG